MTNAARQTLEEPDVRTGRGQLDVAETFATDFGERDFHAAFIADDSAMLHAFVLAAQAFPVGYGAEDARAEQAIALGLEGTVVDRFRLSDFAVRPAPDFSGEATLIRMASKSEFAFARSKGLERYKVLLRFLRLTAAARGSRETVASCQLPVANNESFSSFNLRRFR